MQDSVVWKEIAPEMLEGRGWTRTAAPFDRLPAHAEATVPPDVWGLGRHSAGMCLRFSTAAPKLSVRWSLTGAGLAMPHMPATGVSGIDLYARRRDGAWRFVYCGQPHQQKDNLAEFPGAPPGESPGAMRDCLLYLPLYNGTAKLEIGTPPGHRIEIAAPREKPVVFYGTSITQGGCAARPGMAFPAIIGRTLEIPTLNLGFSGSGKMEPALAELLCELTPSVIVLDCLRNMTEAMVAERIEPFVRRLRERFASDVPIVLAEDAFLHNPPSTPRGKIVRAAVGRLQRSGIGGLHYAAMRTAWGTDGEGTVDGTHPTDIGMQRQAEAFVRVLRPLVKR